MHHRIGVRFKRDGFEKVSFRSVDFIKCYPQKNHPKHHSRTLLLLRQVLTKYQSPCKFRAKKVLFCLTYSIGRQFQNQQLFLFWLTPAGIIVGKVFYRVQLLKKYMFAGYFRLINEL